MTITRGILHLQYGVLKYVQKNVEKGPGNRTFDVQNLHNHI